MNPGQIDASWRAHHLGVQARVVEIVADNLALDPESVKLTSTFEDLGADHLDRYALAMDVEFAFRLPIPDTEVARFDTVGDLVDFVAVLARAR